MKKIIIFALALIMTGSIQAQDVITLPQPEVSKLSMSLGDALKQRRSMRSFTEQEISLQSMITHRGFVDFHAFVGLDKFWVVTIKVLDVVQSAMSAMDVAIDSVIAVAQSDSELVVDPFSDKGIETKFGLSPFHCRIALVKSFWRSHTALPPVAGCAG